MPEQCQLNIWIGLREMPSFQWLAVKCKGVKGSTNICLPLWCSIQHLKVAGGPRSLSGLYDLNPESSIAYKKHANTLENTQTLQKKLLFFQNRRLEDHHFFVCRFFCWIFFKSIYCKEGPSNRYGSGDLPTGGVQMWVNFGGHKRWRWVLVNIPQKNCPFFSSKVGKKDKETQMPSGSPFNNRVCYSYLSYFHGTCNIFHPCSGWFARAHFAQWSQAW